VRLSPIALSFLLATLAVPCATFAQGPAAVTAPPRTAACPVAFSVEREGAGGLVTTRHPDDPGAKLSPGLDLTFRAQPSIIEADITVYGMTPQARVIPSPSAYDDSSESFTLNGTAANPVTLSSIWMKRLGTVSYVELTRLVFSDGATWTPNGNVHCIARPSLLVLVGASAQ
jgi:hypothetical protein